MENHMRTLMTTLVVVLVFFGTEISRADNLTEEATLLDSARFVTGARNFQPTNCAKPRTGTPRDCHSAYDEYVDAQIDFAVAQISYLRAKKNKNSNPKEVERLKKKNDALREKATNLVGILERDYYPLPQSSATTGQSSVPTSPPPAAKPTSLKKK